MKNKKDNNKNSLKIIKQGEKIRKKLLKRNLNLQKSRKNSQNSNNKLWRKNKGDKLS